MRRDWYKSRALWSAALLLGLAGCERREPPGPTPQPEPMLVIGGSPTAQAEAPSAPEASDSLVGTLDDNLPFSETGLQLASIAWRTWIYTDTGPRRTRLGYLRAGAVVSARGPEIKNDGCQGGWYRINPRGFVCIGKGATLDLEHPVAKELKRRAKRGGGFPYVYALSGERSPYRYFKLPTVAQMREVEGPKALDRAAAWRMRAKARGLLQRLDITEELPDYLSPGLALEKPYGATVHPRRQVSAGQAGPDSGWALIDAFLWEGRVFGVSSELDLIPLDGTRVIESNQFSGVQLDEGDSLPVAFHVRGYATLWKRNERGHFEAFAEQRLQRSFKLTGEESDGMLETSEGFWVSEAASRVIKRRDGYPSVATGSRRWIDISVKNQTLVAYVGKTPVYATLISSGRGGLGDKGDSNPDGHRTVRGTFMIHEKSLSSTMNGDEDRADSYELLDVPFVQYFHRGFALHGAYWHEDFGRKRSHGCINLAARDAAWLFDWTDPPVPAGWHAALNKERGTVVYVGY